MKISFLSSTIQAGFPSPADDYIEKNLDLNELLIDHPAATFFIRVQGDSMQDAHIYNGDVLIVDKAQEAISGSIIVAILNGEFTVKRMEKRGSKLWLVPENRRFPAIEVCPEMEFQVWGVVTYVIHKVRPH